MVSLWTFAVQSYIGSQWPMAKFERLVEGMRNQARSAP
jgi:hypothetical protein